MRLSDLPPAGTVLCDLDAIADPGAFGVRFGSGEHHVALVLVRRGERVTGFLNRCPHAFAPLDTHSGQFIAATGGELICDSHGARFDPETGLCTLGPCRGRSLTSVPVSRDGDRIVLG